MAISLEEFADDCRVLLKAEPGPAGREKICRRLEDVLKDEAFIASAIQDDSPERKVLYQDPELGFCIVAHNYAGAKDSTPHDHGPSWAIYGQAAGETEMIDWRRVEAPANGRPGKAEKIKSYMLTPGMAWLYNEGDMHSPRRSAPTRLIRIEGTNMDEVERDKYEAVE